MLYNLLILYICEIGLLTAATVLHNLGKCCNDRDELEEEIREAYVDHSPEEIAHKAIEIVREVVSQHAARQQANSVNRGTFA